MKEIVGFRVKISRIKGKWKLRQNHSEERKLRVIKELENIKSDHAYQIANLMKKYKFDKAKAMMAGTSNKPTNQSQDNISKKDCTKIEGVLKKISSISRSVVKYSLNYPSARKGTCPVEWGIAVYLSKMVDYAFKEVDNSMKILQLMLKMALNSPNMVVLTKYKLDMMLWAKSNSKAQES